MPLSITKGLEDLETYEVSVHAEITGKGDVEQATTLLMTQQTIRAIVVSFQVHANEASYKELAKVLTTLKDGLFELTFSMIDGDKRDDSSDEVRIDVTNAFKSCNRLRTLELLETDVPIPEFVFRGVPENVRKLTYNEMNIVGATFQAQYLGLAIHDLNLSVLDFLNFSMQNVMEFLLNRDNYHNENDVPVWPRSILIRTVKNDIEPPTFINLMKYFKDHHVAFTAIDWKQHITMDPEHNPVRAWCLAHGDLILDKYGANACLNRTIYQEIKTKYAREINMQKEARHMLLDAMP